MKYALITSGSRGIGKAIALRLSAAGWPVVINFLSNREAAQSVADEIVAHGGICELLPFDTSDPKAIETALTEWEQQHPEDWFGVLVNNAGISRDNVHDARRRLAQSTRHYTQWLFLCDTSSAEAHDAS